METEHAHAVQVYGKPGCQGCKLTTKHLEREGIPFNYADITVNEVAHQEVKTLGYSSLPVVKFGDQHFTGFRPDRLNGFKQ